MQRMSLGSLRPDMIMAVDVHDSRGRMLIRAGNPIKESHIQVLEENGLRSVYIHLPPFLQDVPAEILSPEFRKEALLSIRQVYEGFRAKGEADGELIRELASRVVDQVVLHRVHAFQWVDLRTTEEYLPAHVLNAAVLALLIGLKTDLTPARLNELTIGVLMMDIGEMQISPELLNKTEKLTPVEMSEIKKHPEAGFEAMRKKIRGLPAPSMHVAYQHHESFDGTGYPRGFAGEEIHEYARIAAVADMFDALLSDRPFRHYYLPHEAASILQVFSGKILDPVFVQPLLAQVALYPQGSVVQMDTGEIAEVDLVNSEHPSLPRLRLWTDAWGKKIQEFVNVDLAKNQYRSVAKVLKDQEIMAWVLK